MPPSVVSQTEKSKVISRLRQLIPGLNQKENRKKSWLVAPSQGISVYVCFSEIWQEQEAWYGINPESLQDWLEYPRPFVIFVVGSSQDVLIVPARHLAEWIHIYRLEPKGRGDYKLNLIIRSHSYTFREVPDKELINFHNQYSLLSR